MTNVYIYAVDFNGVYLSTANFTRVWFQHPVGTQKNKRNLKRKKIDLTSSILNIYFYSNAL